MDKSGKKWDWDESILAFNLYCKTPFGKIHNSNPDIIKVAEKIGRSPSALSMKMCNFAHFDPELQKRNVSGLSHVGMMDRQIWDKFNGDWTKLALESEKALMRLSGESDSVLLEKEIAGPTDREQISRIRLVQRFFRASVLSSYDFRCFFCGLENEYLLNASHIIPWSISEVGRANPSNGLCLCALHDRAFDRGMVTLDEEFKIVLGDDFERQKECRMYKVAFEDLNGAKIILPERFFPDRKSLEYHRENVFEG